MVKMNSAIRLSMWYNKNCLLNLIGIAIKLSLVLKYFIFIQKEVEKIIGELK